MGEAARPTGWSENQMRTGIVGTHVAANSWQCLERDQYSQEVYARCLSLDVPKSLSDIFNLLVRKDWLLNSGPLKGL